MPEQTRTIRAVFFVDEETGMWIGQGLEIDICAQGASLEEAQRSFETTLMADAWANVKEGREAFAGLGEAPYKFWQMYEDAGKMPPLRTEKPINLKNGPPVLLQERLLALGVS